MNFNDGTTQRDLSKSKTTVDASHEEAGTDDKDVDTTAHERLDQSAMESAKRSQNRIHADEQESPDSTLFTK